ncbi:MAG: hypothetical protein ACKORC_06830 [Acidimicrobiia bacterium]
MARSRRRIKGRATRGASAGRPTAAARRAAARRAAARRRAGDAGDMTRFREGVRTRAATFADRKREASRRACRRPDSRTDD